ASKAASENLSPTVARGASGASKEAPQRICLRQSLETPQEPQKRRLRGSASDRRRRSPESLKRGPPRLRHRQSPQAPQEPQKRRLRGSASDGLRRSPEALRSGASKEAPQRICLRQSPTVARGASGASKEDLRGSASDSR